VNRVHRLVNSHCLGLPSVLSSVFDRVWTALRRGVHSSDFMFMALKNSRQGMENSHDVYCSECGLLTVARSRNNAEGGAANIFLAGVSQVPTQISELVSSSNSRRSSV
jgi:hypothetical protein